jgi:hypothetical protein
MLCHLGAGSPPLILESLIMTQQFAIAREVLAASPSLQDDNMLLQYARQVRGL